MKPRLISLALCMTMFVSLSAQTVTTILKEAKELKDGGNYIEAAKKYSEARTGNLVGKQLLDVLAPEAECYYMLDDYQQLDTLIDLYLDCFEEIQYQLGDSLDVYKAYFYKMYANKLYANINESLDDQDARKGASLFYKKSLSIFEERHNDENVNVLRQELAQLFYKRKNFQEAYRYLQNILSYYQDRLDNFIMEDEIHYYNTLSKMAICNARIGSISRQDENAEDFFSKGIDQIDSALVYGRKTKNYLYYDWLRTKGKILMMQYDRLGIDNKATAKECYEQYVNYQRLTVGKRLSQMTESQQVQNWLALHDFLFDCYRLGNEAPEMLYDLALFGKNYLLENKQTSSVNWKQVRSVLKETDCALEFIQYRGQMDRPYLGCLVLKKDSKEPLFIEIASTDSLLQTNIYNDLTAGFAMSYQPSKPEEYVIKDLLYNDSSFFNKIWTPQLLDAIGNAKRVYFSPDGMLHQLAIEYMIPDTLKDCYRLSSTRVLTRKKTSVDAKRMLIVGDMDYYTKLNPKFKDNDVIAYNYFAGKGTVGDLPFAKAEVDSIIASRHNYSDVVLTGKEATDENLAKQLSNRFPMVHILTHGYFVGKMDTGTDLKPVLSDKTMSRSGLVFTGFLSTLTDNNFDKNLFDGILSASEFAKLDMEGVELVTLSACQTALGTITSDGVFGMQRGLKQAGAGAMIVSLWSVTNLSSSIFYKYFYEELERQDEKDFHKALMVARQKLSQAKYEYTYFDIWDMEDKIRTVRFDHPEHTHQYILIDAY